MPVAHSQDTEHLDSDAPLVLRVGEGDAAAYRELVLRHATRLHHYALRLTRNVSDAEDITQETLLRLWQHANGYSPSARVTTWLHRIAHNLAIDRLRARGRAGDTLDDEEPAPSSAGQGALLDAKRDAEALHRALDALPERQAAAIVLVHLHGMSGAEAQEVLGVGAAALESLLARGRQRLKARLRDTVNSDPGATP